MANAGQVKPAMMQKAINEMLKDYNDDVREQFEEVLEDVAKEATKKLKADSRSLGWANYAKGWTNAGNMTQSKFAYQEYVIHNKSEYYLTHLLEFGHAKQNGGRTRAFPHIAPINDWAEQEVLEELQKRL